MSKSCKDRDVQSATLHRIPKRAVKWNAKYSRNTASKSLLLNFFFRSSGGFLDACQDCRIWEDVFFFSKSWSAYSFTCSELARPWGFWNCVVVYLMEEEFGGWVWIVFGWGFRRDGMGKEGNQYRGQGILFESLTCISSCVNEADLGKSCSMARSIHDA